MTDVTLTLLFPITDGEGKLLNELKIRRPKVKDIRNMKGSTEIEQSISLISIATGLVPEDIDELDIADFKRVSEVVEKMQKGKLN
ncbi:phage tail assembly protein [Pasteurella caecimuris]|uniref:phage tail assembly protein n=1 Tax=Rodentibacter caecimuris TaxID=1796644 RepID=UPI00214FA54B|nr:phage tail assembly protein [Pasteurella caecimuris]MCR1838660.1 phage tail assembly protein [Pasteurella caecimuris]MCU0108033.1 phage tail assembly protein [Pasteurella caecimuris]